MLILFVLVDVIFQLTTSRGGRRSFSCLSLLIKHISTHDLTRRSTVCSVICCINMSISTHDLTRRSTLHSVGFLFFNQNFNSRPHEEVDLNPVCICVVMNISTHDLTRRSTLAVSPNVYPFLFQLTTSQGGRPIVSTVSFPSSTFQLTTSRGGRHRLLILVRSHRYFNSRPHEEVDPVGIVLRWPADISTHDLTRRSTPPVPRKG